MRRLIRISRSSTAVQLPALCSLLHWARELSALGHDARIIDPRLVAPYRQSGRAGKNDFNGAIAICEAAGRHQIAFHPVQVQGSGKVPTKKKQANLTA